VNLEQRAVVWARGRDSALTCDFLCQHGHDAVAYNTGEDIARELEVGAGVLIVAAELLDNPESGTLRTWIAQQAPWSDIPVLIISGQALLTSNIHSFLEGFGTFSVLHRPLSLDTLYSSVDAALRARRRQYQLRELLRQRDETDRRRDEFLAMLAHELRNPLAPIRTGMQVLRLSDSETTIARTRDMIERQLGNLTRLINDLLDVSRITRGKIFLQQQICDLHEVVAGVVNAREHQAAEKGLLVDLASAPPPHALYVEADPLRLEQVIDNVFTNAIKFTPQRGHIDITLRREDNWAVVSIRDSGVGIPPDMLETIFDLFSQTDRTSDRSQGGLGIGLTVVRSLIQLHGGTVVARSAGENQGTEIEIRLPAKGEHESVPQPAKVTNSMETQVSRRVVIIEDNRDTAEMLGTFLRACGHTVRLAHDGKTGLDLVTREVPDAVICDIGLPGMDGYELARRVRQLPDLGTCALIAVTGYGEPRDRQKGLQAGFDHYLVKPADPERLNAILVSQDE
jgi:two-component system, sensor histidine kinase